MEPISLWLLERVLVLVPLLLSLGVHEWAHATAAYVLGDDTAERQGRMTLNPIAHMDYVGTWILPLLGVPIGWAKPVPIEPTRFRPDVSMRIGVVITALAGPLSNLLLAALCFCVLRLRGFVNDGVGALLTQGIVINCGLAVFNLLPVPPLDGSRVIEAFIPFEWRARWVAVTFYAQFALIGLLLFAVGPGVFVRASAWVSSLGR